MNRRESAAYVIDDSPYGSMRTEMRVWVETTDKGQRTVRQTLNPKTDRWNKPKKSTYSDATVLSMNEDGHIESKDMNLAYSEPGEIVSFLKNHPD